MSKKILIISAIILVLTVTLTACKSKDAKENASTTGEAVTSNTDTVVETVPITDADGNDIMVTVYEDANGEKYVTNYQGDKIPVTTDADGFGDDVGSLITQTTAANTTAPAQGGTTATTAPAQSTTTTTTQAGTTNENVTGGHPTIGTGSGVQNTVEWNDIKNP